MNCAICLLLILFIVLIVFLQTSLGNIQEEVTEALNNKNPSVKSETLLFLCRCYQQCTPAMVPKPFLKALAPLTVQVS